jgi:hypothetical protein
MILKEIRWKAVDRIHVAWKDARPEDGGSMFI